MVQPPFRCDYGSRISIGAGTFVNYGCVILDPAPVTVGENCQIASGVQLLTATHPLDPDLRRDDWELAHPVTIGNNVWLGAGVIVNPGVTIGDDSVVGTGAVVTRDLPAGVVAYGVPGARQLGLKPSPRRPASPATSTTPARSVTSPITAVPGWRSASAETQASASPRPGRRSRSRSPG